MNLSSLLPVRWFDGLVVSQSHLSHQDAALRRLLATITQSAIEQPGLLHLDADPACRWTESLRLEWLAPSSSEGRLRISCDVSSAWISPSGQLIVLLASRGGKAALEVETQGLLSVQNPILLAATIEDAVPTDGPSPVELPVPGGNRIEVQPSRIRVGLWTEKAFLDQLGSERSGHIPFARLVARGSEFELDPMYVPPLTRLGFLRHFQATALRDLEAYARELAQAAIRQAAGADVASGQPGTTRLLRRQRAHESLRDLMLSRTGICSDLASVSPRRFLDEVLLPVAAWWRHVMRPLIGESLGSGLMIADDSANRILALSGRYLTVGTTQLLADGSSLLKGLRPFIDVG